MGTSAITQQTMRDGTPIGGLVAPASAFVGILPPELWNTEKEFFTVPLNALGLAVGAPAAMQFQAEHSFDYVFYYGCARARSADNTTVVNNPPITIDMQLSTSGRGFTPVNRPVDADNIFGTAAQPAVWGLPLILRAEDVLTVTATLLAGAAINYRIGLMGMRCLRVRR